MFARLAIPAFASALVAFPLALHGSSFDVVSPRFKPGQPAKGEAIEAAVIHADVLRSLDMTAEILERRPFLGIRIVGHADANECSGEECHELAERRARLVFRYLLDAGIDPRQVMELGEKGVDEPIDAPPGDGHHNPRTQLELDVVE